jgi:hypothetical protein
MLDQKWWDVKGGCDAAIPPQCMPNPETVMEFKKNCKSTKLDPRQM